MSRHVRVLVLVVLAAAIGLVGCGLPGSEPNIMAVGNSYTTGQGSDAAYISGDQSPNDPRDPTDVRHKPDGGCYRNAGAPITRVAQAIGGTDIVAACSGDTMINLLSQVEGFSADQAEDVEVITVDGGGNDLGFTSIVVDCFVVPNNAKCRQLFAAANTKLDPNNWNGVPLQMETVLRQLAEQFPNARFVVTGYPLIYESAPVIPADGTNAAFDPVQAVRDGVEDLNDRMDVIVAELNCDLGTRFEFLPLHKEDDSGVFDGHGLGGHDNDYLHAVGEPGVPIQELVHPNEDGWDAIGDAVQDTNAVQEAIDKLDEAA